jgi:Flp pilus assembly protein TadD
VRQDDAADDAFAEAIECALTPASRAAIRAERARARGDLQTSLLELRAAWAQHPGDEEIGNQLGLSLEAAHHFDEAESVFGYALERQPDSAVLLNNACNLAVRARGIEAGSRAFEQAMLRRPGDAVLRYNFAVQCAAAGCHERAVELYRAALQNDPGVGMAQVNLSLELFLLGRFSEAYGHFETRWHFVTGLRGTYARDPDSQWRGENLAGRSILLWAEQGFGDSIQMVRYVALLRARGACAIHLRVPAALVRLFSRLPDVDTCVADNAPEAEAPHDVHCPFMSLPLAFGTTLSTIPARVPYLAPPTKPESASVPSAAAPAARLRVGLVWHTEPRGDVWTTDARARKSIALASLAPLAVLKDAAWVSLQVGPGREEIAAAPPGMDIVDAGAGLRDFADTAVIIAGLDVVVAVDTAAAHLAAATGKPVLMLLKADSGMFWLLDREDSPWYPGVLRIIRQTAPDDWTRPIARAAELLASFSTRRTIWDIS